jgi:hypothetical protein
VRTQGNHVFPTTRGHIHDRLNVEPGPTGAALDRRWGRQVAAEAVGLKADLKELDEEIKAIKKEVRQTGNLPDKLALQRKARALEAKRDEAWRVYDAAAKEIEVQKDGLLDQVEERLGQTVSDEELFAVRFQVQ